VRGLKHKNVAAELLEKLLGDEIHVRSKRNLVQSREFSAVTWVKERPGFPVTDAKQRPGFPMLKATLNKYHNRRSKVESKKIKVEMRGRKGEVLCENQQQ
jgi:hypothetical protein